MTVSIHAPVKGATRTARRRQRPRRRFNPRPREGGDSVGQPGARAGEVSIHAPVKGATATYCSNELKSLLPPQDCETSISILNKYSNIGA